MIKFNKSNWLHFKIWLAIDIVLILIFKSLIWSAIIAISLAVLKELHDKYIKKTKFDKKDLLAGCEGIFVGHVIVILFLIVGLILKGV